MGAALKFRLLGSFEVSRDGVDVPVSSNKLRVVLATLLLAPNRTVPVRTLMDRLWGVDPPESARGTLQVHMMRLRRALGEEHLILTTAGGYTIHTEPSQVDVSQFRSLVATARRTPDPEQEACLLASALELWRGPALLGVESDPLWQAEGLLLIEERLRALERRVELALASGEHNEVIGELTTIVQQYPTREGPWAQLIDVLRQSGRRADALEAYQRMYRLFRDELGIAPNSHIQRLHREILAEDAGPTPSSTPHSRPGQLPPDVGSFIGRTDELAQLHDRLSASASAARLMIVTGAPGVGKTTLAVHAAHQLRADYQDGQLYANLQGFAADEPLPPAVVVARFLRALGVPAGAVPADPQEQVDLYRSVLAERRVLVVLDNAASVQQVRPLLPGGAGCASLVTSRNALRGLTMDGAGVVTLNPLDEQEARAMLVEMLGKARVAAEPAATADLAEACGRLPLALSIAGANLTANEHLPLAEFCTNLRGSGGLAKLTVHDDRDVAVHAAFDLSYLRLPTDAATVLRWIGVIPGADFTVQTLAAMAPPGTDGVARSVDQLVAANLIFPVSATRYQIHDLIRQYANVRAADDPVGTAAAMTRLLDFALHSTRNAVSVLYPGSDTATFTPVDGVHPFRPSTEDAALAWLEAELPSLLAAALHAHDHGRPNYARQLVEILRDHLWSSRLGTWSAPTLGLHSGGSAAAMLQDLMHHVLGHHCDTGQVDGSDSRRRIVEQHSVEGPATETVTADRPSTDHTVLLLHLHHRGFDAFLAGRPDLAIEWHQQAMTVAIDARDVRAQAQIHNDLGAAAWATGDLQPAARAHERAVEIARELGDDDLLCFSTVWLGVAHAAAGHYALAADAAHSGIDTARAIGAPQHEVVGLVVRAGAWHRSGRRDGVLESYREAERIAAEIDFKPGQQVLFFHMAEAERAAGDLTAALDHAERSLTIAGEIGARVTELAALVEMARCQLALGALQQARRHIDTALQMAVTGGMRLFEAEATHTLGSIELALGHRDAARRCWGQARRIFTAIGAPLPAAKA